MWSHERHSKILQLLEQEGKVATNLLADRFDVSRETVRRDLLEMERSGVLKRVHGGAVTQEQVEPEPAFESRVSQFTDQKQAIGELAASLIPQGSTCFIDAGSTTTAFAQTLARKGDYRVITNSFDIARQMTKGRNCDTLLLGGTPHVDVPATYGELTLSEIDRFRADFAIISPVAIDQLRGLTSYELHEAEVARKMIRNAHSCIVLSHSAKLNTESRVGICRLDEVEHLVTDSHAAPFKLPRGETHYAELG
ncbi:DeoR/GlpR family DNA-binding transcription regulator [Thioclava sp. GXIMD2076]|uniref:DeoR/GlpR family DNA-binding transcription regulator n=1 Tax=Thioclava kandeliae TaxID=3070818 RepID=A0ABV1SIK0_9RHOB